ncbi:hypothetical protein [Tumebacillus avium]|uniref:hypothetical protein n=1 Tax=Tumebacillus avium TaxID=1903704 RepID=UPI0012FDC6F3|nr:hypothetical protein [Tumebacillus avium]
MSDMDEFMKEQENKTKQYRISVYILVILSLALTGAFVFILTRYGTPIFAGEKFSFVVYLITLVALYFLSFILWKKYKALVAGVSWLTPSMRTLLKSLAYLVFAMIPAAWIFFLVKFLQIEVPLRGAIDILLTLVVITAVLIMHGRSLLRQANAPDEEEQG